MISRNKNHVPERTDLAMTERYVSMSNALARSAQGLTLSEKRIVALALAKTDSIPTQDAINAQNRNGWSVKLTAQEYIDIYGIDARTAYYQLKTAAKSLRGRFVKTMTQTHRGIKEVETNWCGQCIYHHGEGWVEIAFTPQIAPHLLGLRKKFTSYKLKQTSALRSIYTWRLFEQLQSWGNKGIWSVDIEKFAHAMEAPKSCIANFGLMRLKVLAPAMKEMKEKGNMLIELEVVKSGRKIIGLQFRYKQI